MLCLLGREDTPSNITILWHQTEVTGQLAMLATVICWLSSTVPVKLEAKFEIGEWQNVARRETGL
jgi:hypothetical protein